jgi:hypothetical protein
VYCYFKVRNFKEVKDVILLELSDLKSREYPEFYSSSSETVGGATAPSFSYVLNFS